MVYRIAKKKKDEFSTLLQKQTLTTRENLIKRTAKSAIVLILKIEDSFAQNCGRGYE